MASFQTSLPEKSAPAHLKSDWNKLEMGKIQTACSLDESGSESDKYINTHTQWRMSGDDILCSFKLTDEDQTN